MRRKCVSAGILILACFVLLLSVGASANDNVRFRYITPIPNALPLDARKVALGEELFNDRRLSAGDKLSCASCHQLEAGGGDNLARSVTNTGEMDALNAPTVFNSAFNFRQSWSGAFRTLEEQAEAAIRNPMHGNTDWPEIIPKLKSDSAFRKRFVAVYNAISRDTVLDAIATFEKSLLTPNAPFDRYLKGEENVISASAKKGYALFVSRGCISCHHGRNVGGNMFQRIGIYAPFNPQDTRTGGHRGRFEVTGAEKDRYVFKVPSLRNVAVTGPYFHDGSVETLEEAVKKMAYLQLGIKIPNNDVQHILSFLNSLTGEFRGVSLVRGE